MSPGRKPGVRATQVCQGEAAGDRRNRKTAPRKVGGRRHRGPARVCGGDRMGGGPSSLTRSVQDRLEKWVQIGAPAKVQEYLRTGVKVEFTSGGEKEPEDLGKEPLQYILNV